MLEESIRNYEKVHPAEIALSLLSFLQSELPAGGTAAETRFLNIFVPLCDCIFGPMVISSPNDNNLYRHKDGGWLSAQNAWTRTLSTNEVTAASSSSMHSPRIPLGRHPSSSSSTLHLSTSNSANTAQSLDSDPVVKLLGTAGKSSNSREPLPMTLIEAITKESQNRPSVTFPLPFHSLPRPLQDAWLALIRQLGRMPITMMGSRSVSSTPSTTDDLMMQYSQNDVRLLGQLLRKGPEEQSQLRLYASRIKQLTGSNKHAHVEPVIQQPSVPMQRGTNFSSTSPASSGHYASTGGISSPTAGAKETFYDPQPESPDILLSMLEYYWFLFLRFPLVAPERSSSGSTATSSIPGVNVHRLQTTSNHNVRVVRETFGETLYYHIFRRCMRHFLPHEVEDNQRTMEFYASDEFRESELFLRLVIAMWLEGQPRLSPTATVLQSMMERRRHRTGLTNTDDTATTLMLDLNSSYDLTQTLGKYEPLPNQVHKCLRTLITHVIVDPALDNGSLDNSTRSSNKNQKTLCLSPCLTILQQPVFNYIRSTFRFAPIHSSSESSFYGALNIWLIWLEPWNVTQSRNIPFSAKTATQHIIGSTGNKDLNKFVTQRSLTIPRMNQASKYVASEWECYIAANVYMYAIPFAIFLRRARELDFSPKKYERSMEIVQRVFRVFTPAVVDAIARHLDSIEETAEDSYSQLKYHRENLGSFAPPLNRMSFSSLKADMQGLLEEVIMHHVKKVSEFDNFDWLMGKVGGLFGTGIVSGEEKTLEALIERAKVITRLSFDYNILLHSGGSLSKKNGMGWSNTKNVLARTEDGTLASVGRENRVDGNIKLNPGEVRFHGDPMRMKVTSYEIPFLVDLTLWASHYLNERLGFTNNGKGRFRINLRFFADYRNSIFVVTTAYVLLRLFWFKA